MARKSREKCSEEEWITNTKCAGCAAMKVGSQTSVNSIKETI